MDNFLVDEELYKSCTVYYSGLWLLKQWQCDPIIIPVHSLQAGVLAFSPFELIAMPSMNNSVEVTDSESESLA